MPDLEDYGDVVANILMVDGCHKIAGHCTCIFYGIALPSADSCREDGRVTNHLRSPETSSNRSVYSVAYLFAIYLLVKYSSEYI